MSNHRSAKSIALHHRQVGLGQMRRSERIELKRQMFIETRDRIKATLRRNQLVVCISVFVWLVFFYACLIGQVWLLI